MSIRQFLYENISRRLKHQINSKHNGKNKELIAYLEKCYPRLDEEESWTECTLSKILNGKSSLSLNDLDTLAFIYKEEYSEIVFGNDDNKLYLIRIVLYSILGSRTLFSHEELERLHQNQKFVKLPSSLLNYWTIPIPEISEIQKVSNILTLLLCKNHDFSKLYFEKLFRATSILDNYHSLLIQQMSNEECIFSNTWLSISESLDTDIEFYVAFYKAFDEFFSNNRKELLIYFDNTIVKTFQEAVDAGEKNPMLVLKDKLFSIHFSSQDFLTLLETILSDDDKEIIRLRSLYQLEKQSKALHTSLYYDKFDYSVLDDVD
ncbi:TPA: hypothetical protein ACGOY6_001613 [Streptococcus suis]